MEINIFVRRTFYDEMPKNAAIMRKRMISNEIILVSRRVFQCAFQ